jgi:hypothetical protein
MQASQFFPASSTKHSNTLCMFVESLIIQERIQKTTGMLIKTVLTILAILIIQRYIMSGSLIIQGSMEYSFDN